MPWLGYPNELIDFWRPDDGRNRTCFFGRGLLTLLPEVMGPEIIILKRIGIVPVLIVKLKNVFK
jgi:hypothetical protein